MRYVFSLLFVLIALLAQAQQSPGFVFTSNPTLCVMHFMHTAIGGEHSSQTYRAFIDSATVADDEFNDLVMRYSQLDFSSGYRRANLPRRRYRSRTVMDFFWLHASASSSLADFKQRTFGLLPVAEHAELFDVLAKAKVYYDRLVWMPQLANIQRTERFLDAYEGRVGSLFRQVSGFYGTPWPEDIPFTVALTPIPLASGVTSAVPKVNTLICSYLSENDEDYKATLGVAVHEMCHSIYDEQPAKLQQKIDDWFTLSQSAHATHAYAFFNEALATAIGNGWAYEQLNGHPDEARWYADDYIDGYARAIFPLVKSYLREQQIIDRPFIDSAIEAFAKTYPDATRDVAVLLNAVGIYADTEDDATLSEFSDVLFKRFRIGSSFLRAPLSSPGALRSMSYPQLTKLVIVDRDREDNWRSLASQFAGINEVNMPQDSNFGYSFYDEPSRSTVLLLVIENAAGLESLLDAYKADPLLEMGSILSVTPGVSSATR